MDALIISSIEQSLVGIARYVSPTYVAEFDKIQKRSDVERPDRILFKDVEEDNFLEWLKNNSLCKLKEPFPEHFRSDFGYLFIAKEGMHIVSPSHAEVNPIASLYRGTQNMSYERRLTIRSQPSGIILPKGLTNALEERCFKRVEQFENYQFG